MNLNTENNKLRKNPFEIPNGYFDSVEDIVLAKLKAEAMNKVNSSSVPDGYFETFEETVISEIKTSKPKVISLKSRVVKIMAPIAITASLLLVFILSSDNQLYTFEDLTSSDIEQWIENEDITFDEIELALVIEDSDLSGFEHSSKYSDEELLEYLNESDLELLNFED